MPKHLTNTTEEYLSRKKINPQTECWEYTGSLNHQGYGKISAFRKTKNKIHEAGLLIHRVSYCYYNNLEIHDIDNLLICHKCDNPKCFNPNHLFIGTHKDNTSDMISKGRAWWQKQKSHS